MRLRSLAGVAAGVFFLHSAGFAQLANRQHLQAMLLEKQSKKDFFKDSSYIDALNDLAYAYYTISPDSLFLYAGKALAYAKKAGYKRGESIALRQQGNGYRLTGDYTNMLSSYQQALAIAEKIAAPGLVGKTILNMAQSYIDMGKTDEALPLAERATSLVVQTRDSTSLNKSLSAIGEIWYRRKQYDSALKYFRQATQIARAIKNESSYIMGTDQVGKVLCAKELYGQALPIYLHSLDYFTHTGNRLLITMSATMVARS